MKNIVLVLLAALTLVGFAAAWDSTDNLYYQYSKTAYIQGGDPVSVLGGTTSGSWFEADNKAPIVYGTEGSFANILKAAGDNMPTVSGASQSGHATLTQLGGATATVRAPDAADGLPEMSGSFWTQQNMHFGPAIFTPGTSPAGGRAASDMVWAQFASEGSVGVDTPTGDFEVASTTEPEETVNVYDAFGAIEGTSGTSIRGADIGVASTTGFSDDLYDGLTPLISGSTTASASFTGGQLIPNTDSWIQSNTGNYETTVGAKSGAEPSTGFWPTLGSDPIEFPTGYPSW